jgi:hypothetical protein
MFEVHVWHGGVSGLGHTIELVNSEYCSNAVHPNAAGNRADQSEDLCTVTVAGKKSLIEGIRLDWLARLKKAAAADSMILTSCTRPAVQIQMHERDFRFEDNVDLMVATLYAIQHARSAQLVLGRSLTSLAATGQRPVREHVDVLFGPFHSVDAE